MDNKPLLTCPDTFGKTNYFDCLLVNASLIEDSLRGGGATPGKDYTIRDLYTWATAIMVEKHKVKPYEGIHGPASQ